MLLFTLSVILYFFVLIIFSIYFHRFYFLEFKIGGFKEPPPPQNISRIIKKTKDNLKILLETIINVD